MYRKRQEYPLIKSYDKIKRNEMRDEHEYIKIDIQIYTWRIPKKKKFVFQR